jgi:hypothetical protein
MPFWRELPLRKFQRNGAFDIEGFVGGIGEAFGALAKLRPAIDGFLKELPANPPRVAPVGKALILDLEGFDEVVEVGLILVGYNPQSGDFAGTLDSYTELRDPGQGAKLPAKFTSKMDKGKKLDRSRIEDLIGQANVIISHCNGFDKPRFQKLFPSSKSRPWLCSLNGLPWLTFGFEETNLEYFYKRWASRTATNTEHYPTQRRCLTFWLISTARFPISLNCCTPGAYSRLNRRSPRRANEASDPVGRKFRVGLQDWRPWSAGSARRRLI